MDRRRRGDLSSMAQGIAVLILIILVSLTVVGEFYGGINVTALPSAVADTLTNVFNKLIGTYNWFYLLVLAAIAMAIIGVFRR